MSVSYGGESITFADGSTTTSGQPYRNRIQNGSMTVDQRNTGNSVTLITSGGNFYPVDRFFVEYKTTANSATAQQVTDAPVGFGNSLKVTVVTGNTSVGTNDYLDIQHYVEGNNIKDLAWGTSDAKTITVSFWVKSSITGTFGYGVWNGGIGTRAYRTRYTINQTNTWEYKTITIPGCQDGSWNTNNNTGISMVWPIAIGSYAENATVNSWISGSTSWGTPTDVTKTHLTTSGSTFQITGVQLEVGSTASSFEHRPYAMELTLCQRYFQTYTYAIGNAIRGGTGRNAIQMYFPTMRVAPSLSYTDGAGTASRVTYHSSNVGNGAVHGLTVYNTSIGVNWLVITTDSYTGYDFYAANVKLLSELGG